MYTFIEAIFQFQKNVIQIQMTITEAYGSHIWLV